MQHFNTKVVVQGVLQVGAPANMIHLLHVFDLALGHGLTHSMEMERRKTDPNKSVG